MRGNLKNVGVDFENVTWGSEKKKKMKELGKFDEAVKIWKEFEHTRKR